MITDAYSCKIAAYHLHESLHTDGVAWALQKAVKNEKFDDPLVHHSDRGLQYCSSQYQQILAKNNIISSLTHGYDYYQNGPAERINCILKQSFLSSKQ